MLIKRNLQLFFRDRANVFASLLAVLIIIGLYILFIGDMMEDAMRAGGLDSDRIGITLAGIMLGGMVAVTSVTACMGAIGLSIGDRARAAKDFFTSPIPRRKITFGYIMGSGIVGFIMSGVALLLCVGYIVLSGGSLPSVQDWAKLFLTVILSVLCANSMVFLMAAFVKSQAAFTGISTVIGALIGFLMGVYIPVGQLPEAVQWIIRIFPMSHAASMFRQILADGELAALFADMPGETLEGFREMFGVVFVYGDHVSSFWMSAAVLAGSTVLFYALSLAVMAKRKA